MIGGMGMPQPKEERIYTIEDIYNLPDGVRAELIDGKIYYMAPPTSIHQKISVFLSATIWHYIDGKNGDCEVYSAPLAVYLNANDKRYLEPDIFVVCDTNKMQKKGCIGAPDWVIEIVSPSSVRMDYHKKLFLYRMAGVREYWIADPEENYICVHNFETDEMHEYKFADVVKAGIYEGLEIDFSRLKL